jgi:hypothetical protein
VVKIHWRETAREHAILAPNRYSAPLRVETSNKFRWLGFAGSLAKVRVALFESRRPLQNSQ